MSAENIVLPIFNVGRKYSPTFLNSSRKNSTVHHASGGYSVNIF